MNKELEEKVKKIEGYSFLIKGLKETVSKIKNSKISICTGGAEQVILYPTPTMKSLIICELETEIETLTKELEELLK